MKNLFLAGIICLFLTSCNNNPSKPSSVSDVSLKKGQMFYHKFGDETMTFIVKDFNQNGYFCTTTEWLWNATEFISKKDLQSDEQFKAIGMYPSYGKKPIVNELTKLKKGDRFQMIVAGSLDEFVVFDRDSVSIMVKDPDMSIKMWSMNIPFSNYNPHFFKKLTK